MTSWRSMFTQKNVKELYQAYISDRSAPGIDKINRRLFEQNLTTHVKTISKKVLCGTYEFTPYKELLVLKSREKKPRLISMPTIRDRVTLALAKELLNDRFLDRLDYKLPQQIIEDLKNSLAVYDWVIKIDIQDFYPSVKHSTLLAQLRDGIRSPKVIALIEKAIRTPTVSEASNRQGRMPNEIGIPQGLPISNILSSVYLLGIDAKYRNISGVKYYRYVDDILILCNESTKDAISDVITSDLEGDPLHLTINKEKMCSQPLMNEFTYLGYCFKNGTISVRPSSLRKMELALEGLFAEYKHSGMKHTNFFVWKLNLRITGCVHRRKKYGWLFFFSQIDDLRVLYHLDWMVQRLIHRYKLVDRLRDKMIKRFVRAHWEIVGNLTNTNYIVSFDGCTLGDKEKFLRDMELDLQVWDEDHIRRAYDQVVSSSIARLERDMQNLRERY